MLEASVERVAERPLDRCYPFPRTGRNMISAIVAIALASITRRVCNPRPICQ